MVPAMQAQAEKKQGEGINAVEADGLLQPAPQSVKTAWEVSLRLFRSSPAG